MVVCALVLLVVSFAVQRFYFIFFKFYAVPFVYFAFVLLPESAKLLQSHPTLCNLMDYS